MKKISLLTINLCLALFSIAQNCIPDQNISDPGIYPEFLDTATVGVSYEHTLQILAIKDTMVTIANQTATADVDSVVLEEILGLPNSFSYSCEPARCTFTWQSVGCAKLSGNPTAAEVGEHPLSIVITSHARLGSLLFPTKDTITDFTLVVQDTNLSFIEDLAFSGLIISPNPSSSNHVLVNSRQICNSYYLLDPRGNRVKNHSLNSSKSFELDLEGLAPAIYTLVVQQADKQYYRRLVRL